MSSWACDPRDPHVRTIERESLNLDEYYRHCTRFDVAVQAGGNIGIWPQKMSARFNAVYTFEPVAQNFAFLTANCTAPNVLKFEAALGDERGCVSFATKAKNMGASYVNGAGYVPVIRLDDLALPGLDFLMLDVEGYELRAIRGGYHTIHKHRPCVVTEVKGHGARYGDDGGMLDLLMSELGYARCAEHGRDVVWRPICA